MISTAWKCLLFWRIKILGGTFKQEGPGKRGGGRRLGMGVEVFKIGSDRIEVGACYTRGARSRRWCGWWGRRRRCGGGGGGMNYSYGMDG